MYALLIVGLMLGLPAQNSSASRGSTATDAKSADEYSADCYHNYPNSIEACTQALTRTKDPREQSHVLLAKGMMLTKTGEYTVAGAVLRQALALTPRDANTHLMYAWALDAGGNRQAADAEYSQAVMAGLAQGNELQLNSTVATIIQNSRAEGEFYYAAGQAFERNRRKGLAKAFYLKAAGVFEKPPNPLVIDAYNDAVRVAPEDADIHHRLAVFWSNWDSEHGAEVIRQLAEAVRLDPENADYRYELARKYIDGGDAAKAVPQLQETVRLRPDLKDAKYDLDIATITAGDVSVKSADTPDTPEALRELELCIGQDGIRAEVACRRAMKIGLSPHRAAVAHTFLAPELTGDATIAEYHAAITADPNYALAYFQLAGVVGRASGKKEDAALLLVSASTLRPDWVAPREALASVMWGRKQYAEAIKAQHEAAALDPEDARLADRAKRWEEEFAGFQQQMTAASKEVSERPTDAAAHQHLAAALAATGRDDEARAQYRAAYKLNPRTGRELASGILYNGFPDVACEIYPQIKLQDPSEFPQSSLEADLDTCARLFPKDTKSLTQLAQLQMKRGDLKSARHSYERLLERDPEFFDKEPQERVYYDRTRMQKGP